MGFSPDVNPAHGMGRLVDFKMIDHSSRSGQRNPDFRSTLLWAPSVKTDASGRAGFSFYASDDTGTIAVKILGMTSDGRPFNATANLQVVFHPGSDQK